MESELDKLVRLISARDYLLTQLQMELRADYVHKIGQYELAALKLSCDAEKMHRKLDIARETLHNGEAVDNERIEEQVEEEFSEKNQLIEDMTANLLMVMGYKQMPQLSREEKSEMLELYQQLAKVYYPDLYPEKDEKAEQWEEIFELYQMCDKDGLAEKVMEAEENGQLREEEAPLTEEQLVCLQKTVQEEIDAILKEFPFTIQDLLKDEEQLAKQRAHVQQAAAQADEEIQALHQEFMMLFEPVSYHLS